jgi:hypothetical protein
MNPSPVLAACTLAVALLSGCAGVPEKISPGTNREEVVQALGAPTAIWQMPAGGTRLQYSRQPQGRQIYDIDLDASGRVVQVLKALDPVNLDKVPVDGRWRSDDVLREFGTPAMKATLRSVSGEIWSYRYMGVTAPFLFHIDVDPQGVVRRTYSTLEPIRPWFGGH